MNKPQRIALFAAVGLIIAMCLYSPRFREVYGRHMSGGYYFILDNWHYNDPIDFSRLFSQIVVVLVLPRFSLWRLRNQIRALPKIDANFFTHLLV